MNNRFEAKRRNARTLFGIGMAVFVIAFAMLIWQIGADTVSASYVDPVDRIRAQDESLFVNSSLRMVKDGDWLTPKFMGRLFLFKPPMLVWLSALSVKTFGVNLFAVRVASVVAGAAGVAAVFLWSARAGSLIPALFASCLLLFSPFWQTMSRLCLTDVCASAFATVALTAAAFDPSLQRRFTPFAIGLFSAASVLSKSVAGVLPMTALGLYFVLAEPEARPPIRRYMLALFSAVLILLPWHVYQAFVHPQWLWADYVEWQLLGIGVHANTPYFARSVLFYLKRFATLDPILMAFGIVAVLTALVRFTTIRTKPLALLSLCSVTVTAAALVAFQVRHLPYLTLLLPGLCVCIALCTPEFLRGRAVAICCVAGLLIAKGFAPWPIRPKSPPLEAAAALRWYANLSRSSELIFVDPDDEFYSATLPLARVRYAFLDPDGAVARAAPHYPPRGIVLTAGQFDDLPALMPRFTSSLRAWGLDSSEPIGTVITLRTREEIDHVIKARPETDFLFPANWEPALQTYAPTHEKVRFSGDRFFLLSRSGPKMIRPLQRSGRAPW